MLNELKAPSGMVKKRKRIGRGIGSGHGKTSTKGHKGERARSGGAPHPRFEGGQMPLLRRIPKRGFNNPVKIFYEWVNVGELAKKFQPDTEIDKELLYKIGLVRRKKNPVKILGEGEINIPLVVRADSFSKTAIKKIESSGGKAIKC